MASIGRTEAGRAGGKWRSEEGVRWVAPIQASSRLVIEDTEIRGCFFPKGDTVMTIQASANRDEEVFEHSENYTILTRPLATARITARAHTFRGEPLALSSCPCCSSASPHDLA
jgi:hypothetical protein